MLDIGERFPASLMRERSDSGVCINCGSEIGFERRRVQPTASRCQLGYEHRRLPVHDGVG